MTSGIWAHKGKGNLSTFCSLIGGIQFINFTYFLFQWGILILQLKQVFSYLPIVVTAVTNIPDQITKCALFKSATGNEQFCSCFVLTIESLEADMVPDDVFLKILGIDERETTLLAGDLLVDVRLQVGHLGAGDRGVVALFV